MKSAASARLATRVTIAAYGVHRQHQGDMVPRVGLPRLLLVVIASVVVYGLGDLAADVLYGGYSFRDRWISELSAVEHSCGHALATASLARARSRARNAAH